MVAGRVGLEGEIGVDNGRDTDGDCGFREVSVKKDTEKEEVIADLVEQQSNSYEDLEDLPDDLRDDLQEDFLTK